MIIKRRTNLVQRAATVVLSGVVLVGCFYLFEAVSSAMPGQVLDRLQENSDLTRVSPNPLSYRLYNDGGTSYAASRFDPPGRNDISSGSGFKHILKNEGTSNVRHLILKAYYRDEATANAGNFVLRQDFCQFSQSNAGLTGNDLHQIQINVNEKGVYGGDNGKPATANNRDTVCSELNNLVVEYNKGNPAEYDVSTGRWVNEIEIKLTGKRYTGNDFQQIRFQVRTSSGGIIGLEKNTPEERFGIVEGFDGPGNDRGVAAGIPFGLSCSDPSSRTDRPILAYDVDVGDFGPSYMFIMKRDEGANNWQRLDKNEYTNNANYPVRAVYRDGANRYELTAGNNQSSEIAIKDMRQDTDYLLIFDTPHSGRADPVNNVLSFSLPGDTINAQVSCGYDLEPSVDGVDSTYSGDTPVEATGRIAVAGGVDSDDHNWQLSYIVASSRPANTASVTNQEDPCTRLASPGCSLAFGTEQNGFSDKPAFSRTRTVDPTGYADGTWICFMMSVSKPTPGSATTRWRHSALECTVKGSEPKVQIWGYDGKVRGDINTSLQATDGRTYGSWGEYGLFSNGINTGMASGSGLLGGGGDAQSGWSNLTFANTPSYGGFLSLSPYVLNQNITEPNGGTSIGATTYAPGTKEVIRVNGTLRINGNLAYGYGGGSSYNSITEIPRVVYIADDIVIAPGVTRIDPWLIATDDPSTVATERGRISTCSAVNADPFIANASAGLRTGPCDNELRFNSPVIANEVYLYRTTRPGANGAPAEIFNLRADAFLSSLSGGSSSRPVATTDMVTELPPRF
jgi:hypothetical protein